MAGKFFDNARGLPWIKSFNSPDDDEHSDRLNHRYTVGFLVACSIVASGSPFVFNRISCWVPAQFVGAYTKYTDNYCWISNTYYVPSNMTVPKDKIDRQSAEIGYYQWTPLIFLLFALFFYLPRMLWRSMNVRSGIDLQYLVVKSNDFKGNQTNEKQIARLIENYCQPNQSNDQFGNRFCRTLCCTSGKRLGNYLCSVYLIVKFLYLINSFLQLVLIHIVLGQPGWFYGIDIWYSVFVKNSVLTDSPYFPRVTLCDLRIREVGNLHRYTVQCVLPINMLNEKMFSLAWFWFIFVFLSNLFSFLSIFYGMIIANSRVAFIRDLVRIGTSKTLVDEHLLNMFTQNFLMQDGVLILKILSINGSAVCTTGVTKELFQKYQEKEAQMSSIKTQPIIDDSDV